MYELFAVDAALMTVEDDVDGERDSDAAAARPNATRLAPGVCTTARESEETQHVTMTPGRSAWTRTQYALPLVLLPCTPPCQKLFRTRLKYVLLRPSDRGCVLTANLTSAADVGGDLILL